MNNVAIVGTCVNLSPEKKGGKNTREVFNGINDESKTTDLHSISDESECSRVTQVLDMI